jgi:hypothetical protein
MPEGRIEHPHLLSFFNGAYELLLGAFAASGDMSSETKGNMREQLVRETLANVLPPFVRLEPEISSTPRATGPGSSTTSPSRIDLRR